jgi:hypothetical protein
MMLNDNDLNKLKGLLHYLNEQDNRAQSDLTFDVTIVDSNGDNVGKVEPFGESDYQFVYRA